MFRRSLPPGAEVHLGEAAKGIRKRGSGKAYQPRYKMPADLRRATAIERARYANMETGFRRWAHREFGQFIEEDVDPLEFAQKFSTELYRFQVRMYISGRRAVGHFDNALSETERRFLHGQHATEMKFFHNFLRDIAAGEGRMDYSHRIDLYALGGYSIYQRGAVKAYAIPTKWFWDVNPEAEHCGDCQFREDYSKKMGGFTIEELDSWVGYPGEKTECKNRCRCNLRPAQGAAHLKRTRPTGYNRLFSGGSNAANEGKTPAPRATEDDAAPGS